jgi:hypothetical protein
MDLDAVEQFIRPGEEINGQADTANQRGGVGKTITGLTSHARWQMGVSGSPCRYGFAGQYSDRLEVATKRWLHQLMDNQAGLSEVITKTEGTDVICSDRRTQRVEAVLNLRC